MTDIAELRKRAMRDPKSLSKSDWEQIHKAAFSVPKKDFSDDDTVKVSSSRPQNTQKREGWW